MTVEMAPRRTEYIPIDHLTPDPANPKAHDLAVIDASVGRFGIIDQIVRDDRTGYIISGHGRHETLRVMRDRGDSPPEGVRVDAGGHWLVPVIVGWASRTDSEARAALIALNRTTELGGWVDDELLNLLDGLSAEGEHGLDGVGFDEDDIDDLRARLEELEDTDSDDPGQAEPAEKPEVKERAVKDLPNVQELVTIHHGDCLDVMRTMADESIDAIVTDPPYELGFMGKGWDSSGIAYSVELWEHALRVLKPGGHLLAFGGTRTWHRLAAAVEDAGFEIRDSIAWLYGSGFPKSLDVSKAIDKAAGAEREVVGRTVTPFKVDAAARRGTSLQGSVNGDFSRQTEGGYRYTEHTAPATSDAEQWQGWGTALKPAFEPIVVGRKPLAGTVAANVLAYGTGALNIDGCRVKTDETLSFGSRAIGTASGIYGAQEPKGEGVQNESGRWPANVVLDDTQAAELDQQSGTSTSKRSSRGAGKGETGTYGVWGMADDDTRGHDDSGGASRFFPTFRYEAKAPTSERPREGDIAHPTVKPLDLMRWLVRLVTPPGGVVLEPFAGSGTTLEAAVLEGFPCIGIEREADYLPLIRQRLGIEEPGAGE